MITQIFSGTDNKDLKINNDKLNVALNRITKNIDFLFDIKNISDLLNLIISLYDMPNLFFQKLKQSKKNYFPKDEKNINIIKKYNEFDIEIYSYLKKNKLFTEITNLNGESEAAYQPGGHRPRRRRQVLDDGALHLPIELHQPRGLRGGEGFRGRVRQGAPEVRLHPGQARVREGAQHDDRHQPLPVRD